MSCSIPNFNFDFQIEYQLNNVTPNVVITNLSTGSNLANISYWFVLETPSGLTYYSGTQVTPDKVGVWNTFNVPNPIPTVNGQVEFSNSAPYIIHGFAIDNHNNICDLIKSDYLCKPNGVSNNNNFGAIKLDIKQVCEKGRLVFQDITNYLYSGVSGISQGSTSTIVYPASDTGVTPPNHVVLNQNSFSVPIPVNGRYQIIREQTIRYTLTSGAYVTIKYKYKNDNLKINCSLKMCSITCGIRKYRLYLEQECSTKKEAQDKLNDLFLKLAELSISLVNPICGDSQALYDEIKEELSKHNCFCDDCEESGTPQASSLQCNDIDLDCLWDKLNLKLISDAQAKTEFCSLVQSCMNSSACGTPLIYGVDFLATGIVLNFILPNQTGSTGIIVKHKLSSSPTWMHSSVLPANTLTYTIPGPFTAGDSYDIKITNQCTSNVHSSLLTGQIQATLNACHYLTAIYGGQANGFYVIQVDNSQTGCNKYIFTPVNNSFIDGFLPCQPPINFKVTSGGVLTWNGIAGNYEVSYKLKSAGTWTVHSTSAYTGTNHALLILASLSQPVSDYDFRIILKCGGSKGDSLPVYTSLDLTSSTVCKSSAGFVSFDEGSGLLSWLGNGDNTATYTATAYISGSPVSALSITVPISGLFLQINFSNIVPLIGSGDLVTFVVQRSCSGGQTSDPTSFTYLVGTSTPVSCPSFTPGFGNATIQNDVITINPSGGTTPNASIKFTQYELRVNGINAGTGLIGVDGAQETKIKSTLPIKTGDTVELRYRSFNHGADSGWSVWGGTSATVLGAWNDQWIAIPGGWFLNGAVAGVSGAFYKITKDGKLKLRGSIDLGSASCASITGWGLPSAGIYNTFGCNILDIAAIFASLNPSTVSSPNQDVWPLTVPPTVSATANAFGRFITRVGSVFAATFTTFNNTGSNISSGILIPLGGLNLD
jgi:hypothetical protein